MRQHSCSLYESDADRDRCAVDFVRRGLERRDQCIHLADDDAQTSFGSALQRAGIEVERAISSRALLLVTPESLRLRGDAFDAYRVFRFWRDSLQRARSARFSGLCAAGEVESLIHGDFLSEHWQAYEQSLTEMTAETSCSFLCQYDRRRATPALVRNVLSAHASGLVLTRSQSIQRTLADLTTTLTFSELSSSLTNDLGARLASIVSHNDSALRALTPAPGRTDVARESLMKSQHAARHAGFLLARFRTLGRKPERQDLHFDLNEALLEVIELLAEEMKQSGVRVSHELAPGLPSVFADRSQIQYVILNLLTNARHACVAALGDTREILVRTYQDESRQLHVVVRDSGSGLPTDVHRVFEPFYSTRPGGLGLGLSTSRAIVASHGGELWATSNAESIGATFQFTLPSRVDTATLL